ncbi:MAG: GDP-mannose 4,6-dehydratase [Candidatus Omnitrophica bacterium]|nr:GDP-mannose 4,6-dehydratase [Candidatus Omnitrophota bacterium]
MNILITGGAGFIGSYLAEHLLSEGHQVRVIDDLSTGRKENIAHLEDKDNFLFIEGSILNYKLMLKYVSECDHIYHLAAAVGVKYIVEHPLESLITNVRGTEIALELAYVFRKKIFLASSSEVYGKNGKQAFKETDDRVLGPVSISRWGYAFSKGFDEFLAMGYFRSDKLPVVIGRLFNICGPRQSPHYGMVIPRFVEQALKNEPITVYGDGSQVRSFTFVLDAVEAMKRLMNEPKSEGEIVNIGSSESIVILELAKKIKEYTNSSSEIKFIPYIDVYGPDFEDMLCRRADIAKMQSLINFSPKVKLDDMLKSVINEYRNGSR